MYCVVWRNPYAVALWESLCLNVRCYTNYSDFDLRRSEIVDMLPGCGCMYGKNTKLYILQHVCLKGFQVKFDWQVKR